MADPLYDSSPDPSNTRPFRAFPSWLLFGTTLVVISYVMQPAKNSTRAGVAVPVRTESRECRNAIALVRLTTDVTENERVSGGLRLSNCARQHSSNANQGEAMNDTPKTERITIEVVLREEYLYVMVCLVPYEDGKGCVYAKSFVVLPGGKDQYTGWAYDDLRKLGPGSHEVESRR